MNEILKNIWDHLTANRLTSSSFEDWSGNISGSEEIQKNVHGYLSGKGLTSSDFNPWQTNSA